MAGPSSAEHRALADIVHRLAQAGFALPGTLIERTMTCGRATCRCKADPPRLHGPYHQWTRKISGKTVTRNLTDDQFQRYAGWFTSAELIRTQVSTLEQLSLRIAERDEGWARNSG